MIPQATRQQTRQIIIPSFLTETVAIHSPPVFSLTPKFEGVSVQGGSLLTTDQPPLGYDLELLSLYKPFAAVVLLQGAEEKIKATELQILVTMSLMRAGQLLWEGPATLAVFREKLKAEETRIILAGSFGVIFNNPLIVPNPQELSLSARVIGNLLETSKGEEVKGKLGVLGGGEESIMEELWVRPFTLAGAINYNLAAST